MKCPKCKTEIGVDVKKITKMLKKHIRTNYNAEKILADIVAKNLSLKVINLSAAQARRAPKKRKPLPSITMTSKNKARHKRFCKRQGIKTEL